MTTEIERKYFQLSLAQLDIYYDQLKLPDSPIYNVGGYIELSAVDTELLAEAHKQLVMNHDAFGLRIAIDPKGVRQYISDNRLTALEIIDVSEAQSPEAEADKILSALFETVLDINESALFRSNLIKLSQSEYRYIGFAHHLAIDGWGFAKWAECLGQYYQYLAENRDISICQSMTLEAVAEASGHYRSSKKYTKDEAFWLEQLSNHPGTLLQPKLEAKKTSSVKSKRYTMRLDEGMFSRIQQVVQEMESGIPQFFIAMLAVCFSRSYSAQSVCFGVPLHNRSGAASKETIGTFTNFSFLPVDIENISTFKSLAQHITEQQKRSFRHQRFPIGEIHRNWRRLSGDIDLYQVVFNYLKLDSNLMFDDSPGSLVYLSHNHEVTPIKLTVWEYGKGADLELQFDFNLAYFDLAEVKSIALRMKHAITQVLAEPDINVSDLSFITEQDNCLLKEFGQWGRADFEAHCGIHDLIHEQAQLTPEKVAVCDQSQSYTYAQLWHYSDNIAAALAAQQIGHNSLVGVCLNRRAELLIYLLGILKVGAAYVPLDSSYPDERLHDIIDDCKPSTVICDDSEVSRFRSAKTLTVKEVDYLSDASFSGTKVSAQQTAYLMYTSGSTGKPKGVQVSHENATALISWAHKVFTANSLSNVLASTSINFDLSVFEMFVPLCCGGRVTVVENLLTLLADQFDVTLINTVPSAMKTLVSHDKVPSSAQVINLAGEPLTKSLVNSILEGTENRVVFNLYGPTEDTVYSTYEKFTAPIENTPSIGRPIDKTEVYIVSQDLQLTPLGGVGELVLGGAGVTQGYLNRSELTNDRFIANTLYTQGAKRLYRTGDLVQYTAQGNLKYLGRIDEQVKVRGHRVELHEIRSKIEDVQGVSEALVIVCPNTGSHLLAYFTTDNNSDAQSLVEQLKVALQFSLPAYMCPSSYTVLKELPLTLNGKVDKRRLPPPEFVNQPEAQSLDNEIEFVLAAIWSEFLNKPQAEMHKRSHFFELGGHSLNATQLISEVYHQLGLMLSVKDVFANPSIEALANCLALVKSSTYPKLEKAISTGLIPASFAQKRIWTEAQIQKDSSAYNMSYVANAVGEINLTSLTWAMRKIIERHSSLRTSLYMDEDLLCQSSLTCDDFSISVYEPTALEKDRQEHEVEQYIAKEQRTSFNLEEDIKCRASLLRFSERDAILLLTVHHCAADGWSINLFMDELKTLYEGHLHGENTQLSELPIQYSDFSLWQQNCFDLGAYDEQLKYWSSQLYDCPTLHKLPLKGARPSTLGNEGKQHTVQARTGLVTALQNVATHNQATLFTLLQSAFSLLIARHSQSNDIIVGTPVANRQQPAVKLSIGLFVNTLVIRQRYTNNELFCDLLQQASQIHIAAQTHQDIPFDYLVEKLNPQRDAAYSPLVQLIFSMDIDPPSDFSIGEIQLKQRPSAHTASKYDLHLHVTVSGDCLEVSVEYNSALFERCYVELLANHYINLLGSIAAEPEQKAFELQMLSSNESHQLLNEFAVESASPILLDNICTLFAQVVGESKEQLAVISQRQRLTYEQLDERASQLSGYMTHKMPLYRERVAVCMPRNAELFVVFLAVLRSGAAYIPIDPEYPTERIEFILQDSGASLLVTHSEVLKQHTFSVPHQIVLDCDRWAEGDFQLPLKECVQPEDLAYLIYTSGSTGKPKGVELTHRGLINLAQYQKTAFSVSASSQVLHFASISFDAATWEWLMALCSGATLHVCSQQCRKDPDQLAQFMIENKITHATLPPTYLHHLDRHREFSFECLIVAGEACDTAVAWLWAEKYPLYNAYGPSETTVCATVSRVTPGQPITIGRPINNFKVYLLGPHLALVPHGALGELYISGPGLAAGYRNLPTLTQSSFISDTRFSEKSERLYKTGDYARFTPSGELEFIGRLDEQVKIRGHRIELSEISQVLESLPHIESALVTTCSNEVGQTELVAYIQQTACLEDGNPDSEHVIPQSLSQLLPSYMVPSIYIPVAHWPLNVNGKIDKSALPDVGSYRTQGAHHELVSDDEIKLADIWSEVLEVSQQHIGAQSNFFALGGHSLLVIKATKLIQSNMGYEVSYQELLQYPTIYELSELLKTKPYVGPSNHAIANQPVTEPATLSFAQERLWFLEQLTNESSPYVISGSYHILGDLNVQYLQDAMSALIERHSILRTNYVGDQGNVHMIAAELGQFSLSRFDLSKMSEFDKTFNLNELREAESQTPFNLASDLMLRASSVKLADYEHELLISVHHIACDGWSIKLIVEELNQAYKNYLQGSSAHLPSLPLQYSDFARWQRTYLDEAKLTQQIDYWRSILDGAPVIHSCPLDYTRSERTQPSCSKELTFSLSSDTYTGLKELAVASSSSLFMVIHAAFSLLLSRVSDEDDIVIGVPTSGREKGDCDNLVGLFLNVMALRTTVDEDLSFSQWLQQVKHIHLEAHAHSDVQFTNVVEALNPPRTLSHAPIFQIMLNMTDEADAALDLPDLEIKCSPLLDEFAGKYDMTLYVSDNSKGTHFRWHYDTSLFSSHTIQAFVDEFTLLCEQIARHTDRAITEYDRAKAVPWVYPTSRYTDGQAPTLHHRFEAVASAQPDDIAVYDEHQQFTFRELNELANRLAHYFRLQKGLSDGERVAIVAQRTVHRIAVILATLKCGAAYVPISLELPENRVSYMLADSKASLVCYDGDIESLPLQQSSLYAAVNIYYIINSDELQYFASTNLTQNALCSEVAHIIYTSGSTGNPKGVLGTHIATCNRVDWMLDIFPFKQCDRSCHITSMSFIRGVWELFVPLLAGKSLYLINRDVVKDPKQLVVELGKHGISRVVTAPSLMRNMLSYIQTSQALLSSLRYWFVSGEVFPSEDAKTLQQCLPQAEIYNLYGSTEVLSDVAYCKASDYAHYRDVPLGRSITGVALNVVDQQLRALGQGQVGELVVSGDCVALGYERLDELTQDQFCQAEDRYFYRTGDFVRRNQHDELEYFGRADGQVKMRGYRIELEEITSVLIRYKAVVDATTVLIGHDDDAAIVAYVVSQEHCENTCGFEDILYKHLRTHLPEYMVPQAIVEIAQLPLKANGKINKQALPLPKRVEPSALVLPKTSLQIALAEIWREVLPSAVISDEIGINENFFQLGGHSLLAIKVVNEIHQRLDILLNVSVLFESPTIDALSQHIQIIDHIEFENITRLSKEQALPISYPQKRFWVLETMAPKTGRYNISQAFEILGELNCLALKRAIDAVIVRHDVLRTNFTADNGEPAAHLHDKREITLSKENGPQDDVEFNLALWCEAQSTHPFDIEQDLLLRVAVLKRTEKHFIVMFSVHHIVADGWSLDVLIREFQTFYDAEVQQTDAVFNDLSIQYQDYAAWQFRQVEQGSSASAYWRQQLSGAPLLHNLTLNRPRSVQTQSQMHGASFLREFNRDELAALSQFCQQHNLSLFMLLQSMFAILIGRHSNEQDVVICTPTAGREHVQLQSMIGCFINTLVLRSELNPELSLSAFLQRNREVILTAYTHQDIPFETVMTQLQHERQESLSADLQVLFTMHNAQRDSIELTGLDVTFLPQQYQDARFELELSIAQSERGLSMCWRYATSVFNQQTIETMALGYEYLLRHIQQCEQTPLRSLPLQSEATLAVITSERDFSQPKGNIIDYFVQHALKTPDAIAVKDKSGLLTYQQLHIRSEQLAASLLNQGYGAGDTVGILQARTMNILVSMLAVMKIGAAYVPLDNAFPNARLAHIAKDSNMVMLLSDEANLEIAKRLCSAVFNLTAHKCSGDPIQKPLTILQPKSPAYVIYTSGSTGTPKGVEVSHGALSNSLSSAKQIFGFNCQDRLMAITTLSFDISALELLLPIISGASCYIADEQEVSEPNVLAQLVEDERINYLQATPSSWKSLIYAGWTGKSDLNQLVGGEALTESLAQKLLVLGGTLWNMYGPTEATIWIGARQITQSDLDDKLTGHGVVFGNLFANTHTVVLNEYGQPQPKGVPGELYIAGNNLANGYRGQPERTAASFIKNPFSWLNAEVLYRTGDIVRYLGGQDFEFIERTDSQIKLRGYRIELGEIDSQLLTFPEVRDSISIMIGEGEERYIASFMVVEPQTVSLDVQISNISKKLGHVLPSYMIPCVLKFVDAFPKTANNKLDKAALRSYVSSSSEIIDEPASDEEIEMSKVWQSVLNIEQGISVTKSFFSMGGNSLLAAKLMSAINTRFEVSLMLKDIFECDSIRALTEQVTFLRAINNKNNKQTDLDEVEW